MHLDKCAISSFISHKVCTPSDTGTEPNKVRLLSFLKLWDTPDNVHCQENSPFFSDYSYAQLLTTKTPQLTTGNVIWITQELLATLRNACSMPVTFAIISSIGVEIAACRSYRVAGCLCWDVRWDVEGAEPVQCVFACISITKNVVWYM